MEACSAVYGRIEIRADAAVLLSLVTCTLYSHVASTLYLRLRCSLPAAQPAECSPNL